MKSYCILIDEKRLLSMKKIIKTIFTNEQKQKLYAHNIDVVDFRMAIDEIFFNRSLIKKYEKMKAK